MVAETLHYNRSRKFIRRGLCYLMVVMKYGSQTQKPLPSILMTLSSGDKLLEYPSPKNIQNPWNPDNPAAWNES